MVLGSYRLDGIIFKQEQMDNPDASGRGTGKEGKLFKKSTQVVKGYGKVVEV